MSTALQSPLVHSQPPHRVRNRVAEPHAHSPAQHSGPHNVALVLVVHANPAAANALEQDFGSQVITLEPDQVSGIIPLQAQPLVRQVFDLVRKRFGGHHSVMAIPVDSNNNGHRSTFETATNVAGLRIDRARREVHTDEGLVALTKGEFEMLAFLAENPGVAYSRPELVDACRGGDHVLDYRAIDVQIFGLRKKLRAASWRVQTIRGFGYRFVGDTVEPAAINRPR